MNWLSYERQEWLRQQRGGLLLIGAAFVVAATTAVLLSMRTSTDDPIVDRKTQCLADENLTGHRVIIIDGTDKFDQTQQEILQRVVRGEARQMHQYEKLTIAALDQGDPYNPHIVFSACAPESASEGNRWSENPEILDSIWRNKFLAPALAPVPATVDHTAQKETPLIETIFGLTLRPDFRPAVGRRRLVIVSDMLQNTKLYSHYHGTPSFKDFTVRPEALQNIPDLTGVSVVGYYIIRTRSMMLQSDAQKQFWIDYFKAAQTSVEFEGWPWPKLQALRQSVAEHAGAPAKRTPHRHRRHRSSAP